MSSSTDERSSSKSSQNATSVSLLARIRRSERRAWQQLVELYGPLIANWCRKQQVPAHDIPDVVQNVFLAVARSIDRYRHHDPPGEVPDSTDRHAESDSAGSASSQIDRSTGSQIDRSAGSHIDPASESKTPSCLARRREGSFRGWLWMITRNKIRDWARAKKPDVGEGGSSAARRLQAQADLDLDAEPTDEYQFQQLIQRALFQVQSQVERSTWQAFHRTVIDGQPTDVVAEELGLKPTSIRQARLRVLRRLRQQLGDLE